MTGPELTIFNKKHSLKSLPDVYNAFTHALYKKWICVFISHFFNLPFSGVTFDFDPGVTMIFLGVMSRTVTS